MPSTRRAQCQQSAVSGQQSAENKPHSPKVGRSLRGYLKSFLILNFAPLTPQLWGKSQFASKSPPELGDQRGLGCSK
ncbi:hypothetical protein LYNGBM3L_43540 [Moorena producens 3L]|uniref:Uncharacterized protein n=1 Tax=Moorena producens 3L TaxID=489825 RepID=F4XW55_9CYAN|nr:hypothetical protein LYNGBM3L_43540 [Moorena producens 3L]OLT65805.1 hypothetical protein BI334_12865 [Moorena producens 3L]